MSDAARRFAVIDAEATQLGTLARVSERAARDDARQLARATAAPLADGMLQIVGPVAGGDRREVVAVLRAVGDSGEETPTREECIAEAAAAFAFARVQRDSLPVAEAARRAHYGGGPSLAELEVRIAARRGQAWPAASLAARAADPR